MKKTSPQKYIVIDKPVRLSKEIILTPLFEEELCTNKAFSNSNVVCKRDDLEKYHDFIEKHRKDNCSNRFFCLNYAEKIDCENFICTYCPSRKKEDAIEEIGLQGEDRDDNLNQNLDPEIY